MEFNISRHSNKGLLESTGESLIYYRDTPIQAPVSQRNACLLSADIEIYRYRLHG